MRNGRSSTNRMFALSFLRSGVFRTVKIFGGLADDLGDS